MRTNFKKKIFKLITVIIIINSITKIKHQKLGNIKNSLDLRII